MHSLYLKRLGFSNTTRPSLLFTKAFFVVVMTSIVCKLGGSFGRVFTPLTSQKLRGNGKSGVTAFYGNRIVSWTLSNSRPVNTYGNPGTCTFMCVRVFSVFQLRMRVCMSACSVSLSVYIVTSLLCIVIVHWFTHAVSLYFGNEHRLWRTLPRVHPCPIHSYQHWL